MTCVHIPNGILTLSDECAPFFYFGKRYSVSEQWGPFRCDANGDPLKNQPVGGSAATQLQGVYEHYVKNIKGQARAK